MFSKVYLTADTYYYDDKVWPIISNADIINEYYASRGGKPSALNFREVFLSSTTFTRKIGSLFVIIMT